MPGVDSTGFVQKTLTQIIADLQSGYRTVYGATVNIASRSRIGQRIALFAGALAEVWELGETLYNALDPDSATGLALDFVLKLNGLTRKPASSSTVTLTLTGTPTTLVATGKRAAVPATAAKFALNASATIASVSAWAPSTVTSVGQRVTNGGNVYQATAVTGDAKTAASGGPAGTGAGITDNHVTWMFLGAGTGAVDAAATATTTGAVQGFAGTITTIDTPVSGWAGVTNVLDASAGQDAETDPAARRRRELSFAGQALSPLEAVRTAVLAVPGVTSCTIFENYSDITNADGVPPKSFETLVVGGADAAIQQAIYSKRPGGIQAYGTTSGTVFDSAGNPHTIAFSRPTQVNIYVAIVGLVYDPATYPVNGNVQVQDSVPTRQNQQPVGKDVVASNIAAGIFQDVAGVIDVPTVYIGTAPSPASSTTVPITSRQEAVFDSSRVTVTSVAGSP